MIKKTAFAKFDLAIHISPDKLNDGYYPVHYIDCQIDLSDVLFFQQKEKDIEIICDNPNISRNEDNFIYKTALMLKELNGNKKLGAKIILKKQIPIKAGFGGGSSDAATALLGLAELWGIKPNKNQVTTFAKELGKDFFYSLHGKLSEVQGEGKNYKVNLFSSRLPEFWLLIIVPNEEKPSTAWVYEHLNTKRVGRNLDKIGRLKMAINQKNKVGILKNLYNDFEDSVSSFYPIIRKMKRDLTKVGSQAQLMAGAGLSVVGFFDSKESAQSAKLKLKDKYKQTFISKIIN